MNTLEKIKDNIRAMLRLAANDGAADGEITNALAFAAKLMDEHNLAEADLEEADEAAIDLERAEFGREEVQLDKNAAAEWERDLAAFAADFVGGVQAYTHAGQIARGAVGVRLGPDGREKLVSSLFFFGIEEEARLEEARLAADLFRELRHTVVAMAKLRYGSVYRGSGREYCEAFAAGLHEKLREGRSQKLLEANQSSDNRQLVLVERRNALIEQKKTLGSDWLRDVCGVRLRTLSKSQPIHQDQEAREQGRADGRAHNTSVNRTLRIGQS